MLLDKDGVLGLTLVAAEGVAELEGEDWVRESTEDEKALFLEEVHKTIPKARFDEFAMDRTGRPYWLMTILETPQTPSYVRDKIQKYQRVRTLVTP